MRFILWKALYAAFDSGFIIRKHGRMAFAAATPTAMPSVMAGPSGIAASDLVRRWSSIEALSGYSATSARCAAAMAAASGEAPGGAFMLPR